LSQITRALHYGQRKSAPWPTIPKREPGTKAWLKKQSNAPRERLGRKEIFRKAVEMALGGNVPMMKFLLDRILPKERPIQLELPRLDWAHDSVDAMAEIVDAVSSGRISPREAADVAQLVSAFTRALDITDTQMEIDMLKSKLDVLSVDFNKGSSDANSAKS